MAKAQLRQYVFNATIGTIEVPGKIDLQQLLVITDTTKNVILYNFADTTFTGTSVSFPKANNTNFVTSLDNSDTSTIIQLNSAATALITANSISSGDVLQILYEQPYQNIRMPEIGTDAFERTRTSNPQSMLDADFEYGLQPTKWLTYDLIRGYPSIYEIPGTDQSVTTVTTDASAGTGGLGESLITIINSTTFPVSWAVGTPITVKGYLNTVQGFARAEGSFLINSVSGNTLTYYAKAKVGVNPGDVLSQTYTQLRQGAFYTGSSVGSTTFAASVPATVGSSSSGSITTATTTFTGTITAGTTTLTTVNSPGTPTVGMILTGGNINPGTYIASGSGTSWTVSTIQTTTTTGATLTGTTNTFTAAGTSSGFAVGQALNGTGILTGTVIISTASPFTGSGGGNGTYAVSQYSSVSGIAVTGTTASSIITVTFTNNHGFVPGDTIIAQMNSVTTTNGHSLAQGPFFVESVPSLTTLTYTARASGVFTGSPTGVVYARPDAFYSHRPFDGGVILGTGGPSHGAMAVRMSKKYIRYQSGKSINYNTGALFAPNYDIRSAVATQTVTTTLTTTTTGTINSGATTITTVGTNGVNGMLISGSGIAVGSYIVSGGGTSSLTISIPTLASITSGTTVTFTPGITIETDDTDHGCQPGASVNILGVATSGFNGVYTVGAIVDERKLIVPVTATLGTLTASINSPCTMQIVGWWGSTVRAGTFDEQNGMFWQWDGQQMSIGRRSSTFQIAGTVTVTPDSNLITGANSRFLSQLIAGDRVVIKGMTHVVTTVTSDTSMTVAPDYRGVVAGSGVKMVKTIDRIVPQSQWNVDRCDGTGNGFNASGYNIIVNKMQMIGLQWTWYGAGFIDWMLRGPEGKYITVHRLRGNNLNTEAYMRSGNQPVRYEVVNEAARTSLSVAALAGDSTLNLTDVTYFPSASATYPAYCYVDNELISYTGKTTGATSQTNTNIQVTAGTLTGVSRGVSLPVYASGQTRTFTAGSASGHNINTGIVLVGQTATPSISHWGSAFLQDGGFDTDRGYIFNYQSINTSISTRKTTAFAIRLAPSVSNAIVGDLGVRDLINRAQLLLQTIEITVGGSSNTNSAVVIEGILNPSNYPTDPSTGITWNSLNSTALQTGQPSFSQIATGTSVTFASNNTVNPTANIAIASGSTVLPVSSIVGISVGDDVSSVTSSGFLGLTKVTNTATNTITFTGTVVTANTAGTVTNGAYISGTTLYVFAPSSGGTTGFAVGAMITGNGVAAGTFITAILSGTATTAPSTFTVSQTQSVGSQQSLTTMTATLYTFAPTSPSGTIQVGMQLTGGSVTAGTYIVQQLSGTAGAAGTYAVNQTFSNTPTGASASFVQINQALTSTVQAGSAITISRSTYAIPGETVFSFISSPANKDSLDLTPFKELTNTPIGGRGTFPNGPDVLFINVYLTQGAPVLANLVLRWGEAQA